MSKAGGLFLIVVGAGIAAYMMPSGADDPEQLPAAETFVVKTAAIEVVGKSALPEQIVAPIPKRALRTTGDAARGLAKVASSDSGGATVITVGKRANDSGSVARAGQQNAATNFLPGDQAGLTRELQRELRRVGCYDGEITGSWTPASRRAMKTFTDRVNATLPIDQPDYILLTLVQGRQDRVCGPSCPSGQGMTEDGRCLPSAVIARAARKATTPEALASATKSQPVEKAASATSNWATTTTVVAQNLPVVPEGRMALSGPQREAVPVRRWLGESLPGSAAVVQSQDAKSSKLRSEERRLRAADNAGKRYVAVTRKKFGAWFFQQQASRNP